VSRIGCQRMDSVLLDSGFRRNDEMGAWRFVFQHPVKANAVYPRLAI
jgi:hypothetical protein